MSRIERVSAWYGVALAGAFVLVAIASAGSRAIFDACLVAAFVVLIVSGLLALSRSNSR